MDTPTARVLRWRRVARSPSPTAARIPTTTMPAPTAHLPPAMKAMYSSVATTRTMTTTSAPRAANMNAKINAEETARRAYFITRPPSDRTITIQPVATGRRANALWAKYAQTDDTRLCAPIGRIGSGSAPSSAGTSHGQRTKREEVGIRAESGDRAGGDTRDDRGVPELLAPGRVGQMNLDQLRPAGGDQRARVADGIGVVREGSWVEHDIGAAVHSLVDPADELGLVIRLAEVDLQTQCLCLARHEAGDVVQGLGAVDVRLATAEPVEVRAIEHIHARHRHAGKSMKTGTVTASGYAADITQTGGRPCPWSAKPASQCFGHCWDGFCEKV